MQVYFIFWYLISSLCPLAFDSHVGDASMGTRLLQKYGVDNLGMVGGLVRYQKNVTSVFSVCRWYCHADS